MSFVSTPPAAALTSGIHTPPGSQFISPTGVWVGSQAVGTPALAGIAPGSYLVSGTAKITGGAAESTIQVQIVDATTLVALAGVTVDVPAGFIVPVTMTPRRVQIPAATTLLLQALNPTITTALIGFANIDCYITLQACS